MVKAFRALQGSDFGAGADSSPDGPGLRVIGKSQFVVVCDKRNSASIVDFRHQLKRSTWLQPPSMVTVGHESPPPATFMRCDAFTWNCCGCSMFA